MSTANAVLLIPLQITGDMVDDAGTSVPDVDTDAGEIAWDSSTSYSVDDRVNHEDAIWEAQKSNTNVEPGSDPTTWLRIGPSNRWAALDGELSTVTRAAGEITYVLRPGFFTGLFLWGLVGDQLEVTIYDRPSSDPEAEIVEHYQTDLWEQAAGLFEYLFMPLKRRTQHSMQNLPLYPDAEVHVSVTAANNAPCEIALLSIGYWDTLIGSGRWGGTQYEAEAEIKSYSYMRRNDDGTVTRVRRGSATNVNCTVVIPADEANHAASLLHEVQGRAVAFIASGLPNYEYLNGFGDVSGSVTASGPNHAHVRLRIEGAVQGVRR